MFKIWNRTNKSDVNAIIDKKNPQCAWHTLIQKNICMFEWWGEGVITINWYLFIDSDGMIGRLKFTVK